MTATPSWLESQAMRQHLESYETKIGNYEEASRTHLLDQASFAELERIQSELEQRQKQVLHSCNGEVLRDLLERIERLLQGSH